MKSTIISPSMRIIGTAPRLIELSSASLENEDVVKNRPCSYSP